MLRNDVSYKTLNMNKFENGKYFINEQSIFDYIRENNKECSFVKFSSSISTKYDFSSVLFP